MLLPEFRDPKAGRPDLFSAVLSVAAVLGMTYGLKQIAAHGAGWVPALSIGAGLALGAVFVRRQRELADPLIDLRLFRIHRRARNFRQLEVVVLVAARAAHAGYAAVVLAAHHRRFVAVHVLSPAPEHHRSGGSWRSGDGGTRGSLRGTGRSLRSPIEANDATSRSARESCGGGGFSSTAAVLPDAHDAVRSSKRARMRQTLPRVRRESIGSFR
jgi:hypothetical protein